MKGNTVRERECEKRKKVYASDKSITNPVLNLGQPWSSSSGFALNDSVLSPCCRTLFFPGVSVVLCVSTKICSDFTEAKASKGVCACVRRDGLANPDEVGDRGGG